MIKWCPTGELSAFSSSLSGTGIYAISSFFPTGFDAPSNGLILWRFYVQAFVTSFDSQRIWTAATAGQTQLRGGRMLPKSDETLIEEVFINRPTQRTQDLWFFDADMEESPTNKVGSGKTLITISNETVGAKYCKEIYYGFEPSVSCTLSIYGSYMVMRNPVNKATFELNLY